MSTIKGFSTKNKNWQSELVSSVEKIILPFEAVGFVASVDPFVGVDKTKLQGKDGKQFDYSIGKKRDII